MEELTRRAEELLQTIEQIKELSMIFMDYCTGECGRCPLKSECVGDAQMDLGASYDIEKCADFIDYSDRVKARDAEEAYDTEQESEAINAWEEANRWAGIDPQWTSIRR